jgi:FkbM family methyltransferase
MLSALLRSVPIEIYTPLRQNAVGLPRGSLRRNISIYILKRVIRAYRGRLAGGVPEIRPMDIREISFLPSDSMVMEAVYWFGTGGYEGRMADTWMALCRNARAILEVGGNVGLFTTIGARSGTARYTVVEPVPAVARILRANLERNGVSHVELVEAAAVAGDADPMVELNIPDAHRGAPVGAFVTGAEGAPTATVPPISVAAVSFPRLANGCDLIKIDAEGIEADLLGSARELLIAQRTRLIVEVLPGSVRLAQLLRDMASQSGQRLFVIPAWGSDALIEIAPADFGADVPDRHHSKDVLLADAAP